MTRLDTRIQAETHRDYLNAWLVSKSRDLFKHLAADESLGMEDRAKFNHISTHLSNEAVLAFYKLFSRRFNAEISPFAMINWLVSHQPAIDNKAAFRYAQLVMTRLGRGTRPDTGNLGLDITLGIEDRHLYRRFSTRYLIRLNKARQAVRLPALPLEGV